MDPGFDFSDQDPKTHQWSLSAFERVAANKQLLLDKAVNEGYDYVWICDTDLLLDPYTLSSLLTTDKPIAAAVYWTRWQASQQAGPQVWLRHPYGLDGRGMDAAEFRRLLLARRLTRVYGLGACMLVKTDALGVGLRYSPLLPELVKQGGMSAGEDRTFCTLAERAHVEMWADPWPDIFHIYHPTDEADDFLRELELREYNAALFPGPGDNVSLRILPLEDVNVGGSHLRGRLAALKLLPELESAVLTMRRGESRMVRVSFPIDWPLTTTGDPRTGTLVEYRGKSKYVDLTLVDHKVPKPPPVVSEELIAISGERFTDSFFYTKVQIDQFRSAKVS